MFIDILIRLGQFGMARERLEKMRIIPQWVDDIRFILLEATICLTSAASHVSFDGEEESFFTVTDCLYSFHGSTVPLVCGLAASFVLLGKFSEAQNALQTLSSSNQQTIQHNSLVMAILLADQNSSVLLK
jgi:hypothetical protein